MRKMHVVGKLQKMSQFRAWFLTASFYAYQNANVHKNYWKWSCWLDLLLDKGWKVLRYQGFLPTLGGYLENLGLTVVKSRSWKMDKMRRHLKIIQVTVIYARLAAMTRFACLKDASHLLFSETLRNLSPNLD